MSENAVRSESVRFSAVTGGVFAGALQSEHYVRMNLGPTELVVLGLFFVVPATIVLWGLIDAATEPAVAWERVGQSQTIWIVLLVVGLLLSWLGMILSIYYLVSVRPKLKLASSRPA